MVDSITHKIGDTKFKTFHPFDTLENYLLVKKPPSCTHLWLQNLPVEDLMDFNSIFTTLPTNVSFTRFTDFFGISTRGRFSEFSDVSNFEYLYILAPPQYYSEAFYNETVEVAENMDNATAEHFFMFLTLVVFGGLVFLYFASKVAPKKSKTVVETGTAVLSDSSWIPQEHMKSTTPTSSPNARRRKAE